jgi:hypothetical protein
VQLVTTLRAIIPEEMNIEQQATSEKQEKKAIIEILVVKGKRGDFNAL